MMGLYFEELELGQVVELGDYAFTDENIRRFKEQFAPVPFHLDDDAAAKGLFGRQVAVGFHICSAWMPCFVAYNARARAKLEAEGKVLPEFGPGFGLLDIRWPTPVFAGDVVTFHTTLSDKRELKSNPAWGMLEVLNQGRRRGELVVSFKSRVMVARRR